MENEVHVCGYCGNPIDYNMRSFLGVYCHKECYMKLKDLEWKRIIEDKIRRLENEIIDIKHYRGE